MSETIDITPNWATTMEMLLLIVETGTPDGRSWARGELRRLARELDKIAKPVTL